MRLVTTLLACSLLASCGDDSESGSKNADLPKQESVTQIIRYQFDGDAKTLVMVTKFGEFPNKTVTIAGDEKTMPVEPEDFDFLWSSQENIPIIMKSMLGESFSGIDTETHHIISFIESGGRRTERMSAVLDTDATPAFREWVKRALHTGDG